MKHTDEEKERIKKELTKCVAELHSVLQRLDSLTLEAKSQEEIDAFQSVAFPVRRAIGDANNLMRQGPIWFK